MNEEFASLRINMSNIFALHEPKDDDVKSFIKSYNETKKTLIDLIQEANIKTRVIKEEIRKQLENIK